VKDADEILVLDDGTIAERGTHRDLLERGGLYAAMYRRQLLEEELEVDEEQSEHEKRVRSPSDEPDAFRRARPRVDDLSGGQD
jgi:ABC-type glutathione transport system ATPase component